MMNTPSRNRTLGTLQRSQEDLDRFIPNRSAMDFDYARYMLTGGKLGKENSGAASTSRDAYQKKLIEVFNMNRGRILKFNSKPPASVDAFEHSSRSSNPTKSRRRIPKSAEKILDASGLLEDYYTNLLGWGSNNIIAIGIRNSAYLWNASNSAISELVAVDDEDGHVTSLSWASDGRNLAVGLDNSHVQIWDAEAEKKLRTLRGCHRAQVDSLAWSDHIITTGGMDAKIVNNDVRMRQHVVGSYRGHKQRICGLRWSGSGRQLASGGADNILLIWDRRSMVSSTSNLSTRRWIYRFEEHTSAVRALAWCPLQSNLLASGGGVGDRSIKLWDTNMGSMLKSVNTGSQVCSLVWSRNEWEILSSHGFEKNELLLWKYPSMKKMAELEGHTSRVLHMAQSPDGCMVATAGDETLRFWNVFGSLEEVTRAQKANRKLPFSGYHISIR